jgi:transposase
VCGAQAPFVRRGRGEPIRNEHTKQHRPFVLRVMFWGALCGNGPVALCQINGTMTSKKYVDTLDQYLVPFLDGQPLSKTYVFQHDNAPSHKAYSTQAFLLNNVIEMLPSWPPYSPDLNVIENMWAYLKQVIRRESVNTKGHLAQRVQAIWCSEEVKALCHRLVASMPRRIDQCIANKGGYVKY